LKKLSQKRAGGVAQGVGSEFKPQNCKNTCFKILGLARILGVAQALEYLPSKHEALSFNPSSAIFKSIIS
jgi:hypothetical protein